MGDLLLPLEKAMKRTNNQRVIFKVDQAIGSMAMENAQVSREMKAAMLRVAGGRASADDEIERLLKKYRQME